MIVYRLEKDGIGPYMHPRCGLNDKENSILCRMGTVHSMKKLNDKYTHPTIHKDITRFSNIDNPEDYICGFKSLKDLKQWFRGFLTDLKKIGFDVVIYNPKKHKVRIGKSNRQLIFIP